MTSIDPYKRWSVRGSITENDSYEDCGGGEGVVKLTPIFFGCPFGKLLRPDTYMELSLCPIRSRKRLRIRAHVVENEVDERLEGGGGGPKIDTNISCPSLHQITPSRRLQGAVDESKQTLRAIGDADTRCR